MGPSANFAGFEFAARDWFDVCFGVSDVGFACSWWTELFLDTPVRVLVLLLALGPET